MASKSTPELAMAGQMLLVLLVPSIHMITFLAHRQQGGFNRYMIPHEQRPGASAGAILRMKIQDEFTAKPWPKWKKRYARLFRDGRCQNCPDKVAYRGCRKCLKHLVQTREYQRQRRNCKRRYWSASYKLQEGVREEAI